MSSSRKFLRILVAPNAFKESLSAVDAAAAISRGLLKVLPNSRITQLPIADGGDGTLEAVVEGTHGKIFRARVLDPLGKKIFAHYGLTGDGKTAVIEMSRASGLALVPTSQRNPMRCTSYGTGQLIKAALKRGVHDIILGIGGSATVDGGIGALQALGVEFLDRRGRPVGWGGNGLKSIARIDMDRINPLLKRARILVACDVDNPLVGPRGSAAVFGPQKGATPGMVRKLDERLGRLGKLIQQTTGRDVSQVAGSGAAGGIAGGFMGLLGARLSPGSDLVFDLLQVEEQVKKADLIFTGEGQIDFQTPFGKGPGMLAKIARENGVPVIGIAGSVAGDVGGLYDQGFTALFSIVASPLTIEAAIQNADRLLEAQSEQLARLLRFGLDSA
ncbi:MAG: glycerate kinase [Acidobacteria bacterium]|nr:glycerate kinase [Acidobacteriota bacterium]